MNLQRPEKKIILGIDTQVLREKQATGFGIYTANLIRFLAPECEKKNIHLLRISWKDKELNSIERIIWSQLFLPVRAFLMKTDILFIPAFATPIIAHCPKITVVHDLIGMLFPQNLGLISRFFWSLFLPFTFRFNQKLLVISKSTKNDLQRRTSIKETKIVLAYQGIDYAKFERISMNSKQALQIKRKYSLPDRYFLFTGTMEPRKNLEHLIRAYALLPVFLRRRYSLVVAGKKGWRFERVFELCREQKLIRQVRFLGYVENDELPYIYGFAAFFVFPSRYEGFGIPLLEATAAGLPIAAAQNSSITEVLFDCAELFNEEDPETIAIAMTHLEKKGRNRKTVQKLRERHKKQFSWPKTAKIIAALIEQQTALSRKR